MNDTIENDHLQLHLSQEEYRQTLISACQIGTTLFGVDYCSLLFRDFSIEMWFLVAEYPIIETSNYYPFPLQNLPNLIDLQSIEAVLHVPDLTDSSWSDFSHLISEEKIRSFTVVPVKSAGELTGIILLGSTDKKAHSSNKITPEKYVEFGEHVSSLRNLYLPETKPITQPLIDIIPDYIYVKDKDSRFTLVNLATAQLMSGGSPNMLIGKTDFEFYPEQLAQKFYEDEQELFTSGQELVSQEEEVVDFSTKKKRLISTTKVPVTDGKGEIIGLFGISRDITALREENKKIRSLYEAVDEFIESDDPDDILELAVKRAREAANAQLCSVISVDRNGQAIALKDDPHDKRFDVAKIRPTGHTNQIVKTGEPVAVEDISQKKDDINPMTLEQGFQAVLGLPLTVRNVRIGAIWLHYEETRSFPEDFIRDMQFYANYVAIAFDKAQRIKNLDQLQQASRAATRATALNDLGTTLGFIVNGIHEILKCDIVTLYYVNTYSDKLNYKPRVAGRLYEPQKITATERLEDKSFVYQMLKRGKFQLINDTSEHEDFLPSKRRFVQDEKIKTCAVIPLTIKRGLQPDSDEIGIMFVNFRDTHHFTDEEIDILSLFADQAAIAIDNAQMYERAKWRSDIYEMFYKAFTDRDNVEDIKAIIREIPYQILIILGEKSKKEDCISYVSLLEGSQLRGLAPSRSDLKLSIIDLEKDSKHGIVGRVVKTGQPSKINNVDLDDDYLPVRAATKSQLSVPISSGNRLVGVITVEHPDYGAFSEEDQRNVEWLAIQVALAIEKTAMLQETRVQTNRLIQTRDTAHRIAQLPTKELPRKVLLERIGELVKDMVGCDLVSIYTKKPKTRQMEVLRVGDLFDESKRRTISTPEIVDLFQDLSEPRIVEDLKKAPIFSDKDFPKKEGLESSAVYPLRVEQENDGFILLNCRHTHHFKSDELANIRFIVNQVAIAIRTKALLDAETRQKQELDAVYETAVNILSHVDFQKRLDVIVEACRELLNVKGAKLYLLSRDKKFLKLKSVKGSEIGEFISGFPIDQGVAGHIIRENLPYYIVDDYASSPYKIETLQSYFSSVIEVPLLIDRKPIGILGAFADNPNRIFNQQVDLPILERLAKQAVLAIRDSQLLEQSNKLRDIANTLSEVLEPKRVANAILDGLEKLIFYETATLQLIDGDERTLLAAQGIDWENLSEKLTRPISKDRLIRKILRGRKIRVIPYTHDHPQWDIDEATKHVLSWIGIPLWAGDESIALITIDHSQPGFYDDVDKELLELFAGQAAIAINNALLFRDLEKKNEQLTETQYQLEQTQSLAMIGLFYGEDIHFTSNKLGAARAHAKYIREHPGDRNKVVNKAKRISNNVAEILELIDFIQETIQPPDLQQIDLYDLLEEAISAVPMSRLIRHKWPCKPIDGTIFGLRRQLRQVFRVVIFNAVKAMPEGKGTISYCLKDVRRDDIDYVLVSITDTGVGIPKSVQPYVFKIGNPDEDRYKAKSFSFGLAWANLFLQLYGGDIYFETRPKISGTTLYVLVSREFTHKRPS